MTNPDCYWYDTRYGVRCTHVNSPGLCDTRKCPEKDPRLLTVNPGES